MEDKPKSCGRGSRLLEKIRARASETESTSRAAEGPPPEIGIERASHRPHGRGFLLTHLTSFSEQSAENSTKEIGVSSDSKPEIIRKGRGFLAQLAKQATPKPEKEAKPELATSTERVPSQRTIEKAVRELSLTEEEVEKPPVIRRGETGDRINISLNYVKLKTDPGKGVFEYEVRFSPEIDYAAFRYKLINQHFKSKRGIRCYDGAAKLYMPEKLKEEKLIITSEHPNDQSMVNITITFKKELRLRECSQLYNTLFNNCSKALRLTRLGRQHFDHTLSRHIPQHKLEIWPGYVTAVEEFEGGIHLYCDIRHRVLRTETAYDVISSVARFEPQNVRNLVFKELLGQCVLTRYNNNLYRIDDIDWNQNPMSTFKLSSGETITFLEYYKKQYNLQITDLKQPLLINKPKKTRHDEDVRLICLVPELCYLTGLTDKMRKDMKVMKEIASYTRVTPVQRQLAFEKFLESLRNSPVAQEMLNDWGLKLADEPLKTEARVLYQEDVLVKNRTKHRVPPNLEWSKFIRDSGVFRGTSIRHWILVHTRRDSNLARSFWNMLQKVGPGLGIDICDPALIPIPDDRIDSYIRAVRENITSNLQMVVCLCPTPREDRYSAIKRLCCRDLPIPSQVVNCSTLARENRMRSVVQNIALQMNNKIGGASWAIHIPLKNTMICGIDSYHDADKRGCSVGAFVASVDAHFTRWYSKTCIQDPKQELIDGLVYCFALALKKYLEINNVLPERVIIFRDGVGDGQLDVVQNHEVSQFLETCDLVSKRYKPKFSFIVVQKRINTKFFRLSNGSGDSLENPPPGCVLDHTVTRRNFYDFFLVSQFVSFGTASPTHYIVLYDTSELKPDLMQRLTYKCCHLYYNWAGTVRIPAPCQYAHKLAFLVGQNVKELPKEILDDTLYYL